MNVDVSPDISETSDSNALLRTLVLCDLVDSTALIERLGDRKGAELIRKHDRLARTIADRHGGREIDKTDGFLMMFERPIQAVAFALDYQRGLRQLNAAEQATLSARVGIHVGDVFVWENTVDDIARGAKPIEVEGLIKPITSRLMSLALPGQILLSSIAYDLARRAQGELGVQLEKVRWRTHGRYRFRGIPDPVPVFEIGEEGFAPLKAPAWSSKAHREVPLWRRPATVAIEALVIAVLLAIPLFMFLRPEPAIAFVNRDWIVVGSLNNLTGETIFDEALESALRIGLEQSRYVNVLPDLKVRDTVERMQRDPDQTAIDRVIGSEVAIRDGARALILPTIAEIGGRVRITAEVIDPQTQTTVYSESADGIGVESILPSLDTINGRLRVRLGEALATVASDSLPLEKVTTKNIDALRIYSQALRTRQTGDMVQTNVALRQAILLDPAFARARIELATTLMPMGKYDEAKAELEEVAKHGDRLSAKDRLMTEALLADFASPAETLSKWKALATSYPDFFRAQGAYGFYAWRYGNDFNDAILATRRNISKQNPAPGLGNYLLATLLTGVENFKEAEEQFELAEKSGTQGGNYFYAAALAAQRQYSRIPAVLAKAKLVDGASLSVESRLSELAIAIDQGDWSGVAGAAPPKSAIKSISLREMVPMNAAIVLNALSTKSAGKAFASDWVELDSKEEARLRAGKDFEPNSWELHRVFHAWLTARYGDSERARKLVGMYRTKIGTSPALERMAQLVDIELERAAGNHENAVKQLLSMIDGLELYVTHLALMESLIATGDYRRAREQARWLSGHRGRAYTEVSAGLMFVPFNVAQSNLALLVEAECSFELGEKDDAKRVLNTFKGVWPAAHAPEWLARRVTALESRLEPNSGDQR